MDDFLVLATKNIFTSPKTPMSTTNTTQTATTRVTTKTTTTSVKTPTSPTKQPTDQPSFTISLALIPNLYLQSEVNYTRLGSNKNIPVCFIKFQLNFIAKTFMIFSPSFYFPLSTVHFGFLLVFEFIATENFKILQF